jgi:hypothetical protein
MHTNSPKAGLTFPSNQNPSLQSFKQIGEFNLETSKIDLSQLEVFLQNLQKENRKENQKEKEGGKGRGKRFGPKPEPAHGPTSHAPELVPPLSLSLLLLTAGPTHQLFSTLAKNFAGDRARAHFLPLQFSFTHCLNRCLPTPINPPSSPLHFPLLPLCKMPPS